MEVWRYMYEVVWRCGGVRWRCEVWRCEVWRYEVWRYEVWRCEV